MRILFDNVDFSSTSGPNHFARKLAVQFARMGHTLVEPHEGPEVQLSFIQATGIYAPMVQRLDGIWFNTEQDWQAMNGPIKKTYEQANGVVFQSNFNQALVEKFFGLRSNPHVIHNGADVVHLSKVLPLDVPSLKGVERVWSCASSWRPHKRLNENVRYFLEHAGPDDCLVIAGRNPDVQLANPRIFYTGDLDIEHLYALYRATDVFLHLSYLDHCPQVVVDARAAGCQVVCSSLGGTKEVAGPDAIVIEEDAWDFEPCALYKPPKMDFSRKIKNEWDTDIDIKTCAERYLEVFRGLRHD